MFTSINMSLPTPPNSRSSSRSSNIYNPDLYPLLPPTPGRSPRRRRKQSPPPLPLQQNFPSTAELKSFFSPCTSDSDSDFSLPNPSPPCTLGPRLYQREPPTPPPRTPLPALNFAHRSHLFKQPCATPTFGPSAPRIMPTAARQDRDRLLVQTQKAHLRRMSECRLEFLHQALEKAERKLRLEELAAEEEALLLRMREVEMEREALESAEEAPESWWSEDESELESGDEDDGYQTDLDEITTATRCELPASRPESCMSGEEVWFEARSGSPVQVVAGVAIEMI